MAFYLGIDGGGSKTTCAVGDDASSLASATAGPSNIVRVGETQARESLHQAVRQACAAAGIIPAQVAHTTIGAAGAVNPDITRTLRRALAEILPPSVDIVSDIHISLEAAFDTGPGVIVIAGTGSVAYGRNQQGMTARAGGWGFAISDEGSAHWIGRTAISSVLRAKDSCIDRDASASPDPPLLRALLKAWGVSALDDFLRAANSSPGPDFAALFPAVLASAEAADELALQVLTTAGTELARVTALVVRRLFNAAPAGAASVPVAMVGGVFRHTSQVREVFYNELRKLDSRVSLRPQIVEPVEGALRMARRAARPSAASRS